MGKRYKAEEIVMKLREIELSINQGMDVLSQLFIIKGTPQYIRSDNGPEFIAKRLRCWLKRHWINTLFLKLIHFPLNRHSG